MILLIGGSNSANPPVNVFGAPVAPAYAADIQQTRPDKVSFEFERTSEHGWVVEITVSIPSKKMTHEDYVNAAERIPVDAGEVVVADHLTCRYAVPAGSRYLPEVSGGTTLTKEHSGDATNTDVWSEDCAQFGYDPTPDSNGISSGGGAAGSAIVFALPDSVLHRGGDDDWSLVYQLQDGVDSLTGGFTTAWEGPHHPVEYEVHPRDWGMQAFVPGTDSVTVNNPSELKATRSAPAIGVTRTTVDPVFVALTDPSGRRRSAVLIAVLSLALPFLAQGALRHLFVAVDPTPDQTRDARRSGNPGVRQFAAKQHANRVTTKSAAKRASVRGQQVPVAPRGQQPSKSKASARTRQPPKGGGRS